jgi:excisionase family DNA binding protein
VQYPKKECLMEEKFLTVKEAAYQLRRSKWAVYRGVSKGEIPAVRVSASPRGGILIPEDELRDWIYGPGLRRAE